MLYLTNEDRQRQTLARGAAQALADMAGWKTEPAPNFVHPCFGACLYSPRAEIIIAPWRKETSLRCLMRAAREARLDVLHVEPGWISAGIAIFYAALILSRNGGLEVYRALRLWSEDVDTAPWLVPDPDDSQNNPCFDLCATGLKASASSPYVDRDGHQVGLSIGKIRWHAVIGGHLI